MTAQTKHIVFDWNSTLLDDFTIIHDCMNRIMALAGRPAMSAEHFRKCYSVPSEQLYRNLGFAETEIGSLIDTNRDVFHNDYETMAETAPLRDGAEELLTLAKGRNLGTYILSNHIVEPIQKQLRRHKIEHLFTDVLAYASRETQFQDMTKGEKLRRYRIEKQIAEHPAVIVGDSVEEIHIGRDAGMVTVAITGGGALEERLREEKPDYVIHSLRELTPILQERGFV